MNTFQQDLPLVVVIIILFIDIRDGNESTNSCGNSPVVDQNVWDFPSIIFSGGFSSSWELASEIAAPALLLAMSNIAG